MNRYLVGVGVILIGEFSRGAQACLSPPESLALLPHTSGCLRLILVILKIKTTNDKDFVEH